MSGSKILIAVLVTACCGLGPGHAQEVVAEEAPKVLGVPSEIVPESSIDSAGHVLIEAGTRLYGEPDVRSATVAMIDAEIELAILGRQEHWVEVRYGAWKGWVATGVAMNPVQDGWAGPNHVAWRLALAREMLGLTGDDGQRELGPFALHTDVENPQLLRYLSRISNHLPAAYRNRYDLEPQRVSGDAVVLFSREEDYRAYEAEVRPENDRGALGHAAYGLAVLYVGRQGPEDVAAVLVHELTHVLSHRSLATSPPPWLDEGMANDLAFCRIDGARRLVLGSLGGRSVVIEEHSYRPGGWIGVDRAVHLSGPRATRNQLKERWRSGGLIGLRVLSELSSGQFFYPEDRQIHYDTSAFFVRYLLDGEDGELASGFRAFLTALADKEGAVPSDLVSYLERTWSELEDGFAAWLGGAEGPGS